MHLCQQLCRPYASLEPLSSNGCRMGHLTAETEIEQLGGELGRLFFALRRFSGSASSIGKAALIDIDYHPRTGVIPLLIVPGSTSDVAQGCFEGAMG